MPAREHSHARPNRSRAVRGGSVVPFRVLPPFAFVATGVATSSSLTPIGQCKNERYRINQPLPTGRFRFQLLAAFRRQAIELRLASSLRLLPICRQEAAVF